jgi:hypothetical protein
MRPHRRTQRWLSGWLAALLLFTQLMTAAYACPAVAHAPASTQAMADMPDCAGHRGAAMDPEQPLLCQAHCQQGAQTVHPTPAVDAPAIPLLLAVLDWAPALLLPAQCAARSTVLTAGAAPPGDPPLYISLLVLRN